MSAAFASKRVATYARYSSSLQNERSIVDQVRRCADQVRAGGGNVDENLIFTDMAISAASLKIWTLRQRGGNWRGERTRRAAGAGVSSAREWSGGLAWHP